MGRRSVLVRRLLVLLGRVVLDDDRGGRLRRGLRDVDLGDRLLLLLLRLLVAPPSALHGGDGHSCPLEHLEVRLDRDRRLGRRRDRLASDPDEVQRVVELRGMKLLREEVTLVVGGRCLLESELPVRGRGPIVVLVLEENLVEMSQGVALCPLQVPQARRAPLSSRR